MTTAQDRLNTILPSWFELLQQWSNDGSLAATAEHVLDLDGENAIDGAQSQLQGYIQQWSLEDFESIPPIVLLSDQDISGAQGAYAASTDTIYLNEDWLLIATEEAIVAVLTEELGAFLDDQLNTVDTQGDEGAFFSAELLGDELSDAEVAAIQVDDDSVQITTNGISLAAEASASTRTGKYLNLSPASADALLSDKFYIPESGDFTISVWAQLNTAPTGSYSEILSQGFSGGEGFYIGYDPSGNIRIGDSWRTTGIAYPVDKKWHNFQVVKQGDSGYLYIDGILNATTSLLRNPRPGSNLIIGKQFPPFDEYWSGGIDELRIYDKALSQDDLDAIRFSLDIDSLSVFQIDFENGLYGTEGEATNVQLASTGSPSILTYDSEGDSFIAGTYLFADSLYKVTTGLTWIEAQQYSRTYGGDLVTINSSEENAWLFTNLPLTYEVMIGLSRPFVALDAGYYDYNFDWAWSDGTPLEYTNWNQKTTYPFSSEATNLAGPTELYGVLQFPGAPNPGTWYSAGGTYDKAITEYSLDLFISTEAPVENGESFVSNITLNAGNELSGNLANGATVYWKVGGITEEDLKSGELTGSAEIINGNAQIIHALVIDGVSEEETFDISIYSDPDFLYQIGDTFTQVIQEVDESAQNTYLFGSSLYYLVTGDWIESETQANNLGGHLITINDQVEQDWMVEKFSADYVALWLGLNDREVEGQFRWTSGEEFIFDAWNGGEPSDGAFFDSRGEDVVQTQLSFDGDRKGLWNDVHGDFQGGTGLAEFPLNISFSTQEAVEGGSAFDIDISFSTLSQEANSLLDGLRLYWDIQGIQQEDLSVGFIRGMGTIDNGSLKITNQLIDDQVFEEESIILELYFDEQLSERIGEKFEFAVQDSQLNPSLPVFGEESLGLNYISTNFSEGLFGYDEITGQVFADVTDGSSIVYSISNQAGDYGALSMTAEGITTFSGNSSSINTQSTSVLTDTFSVTATNGTASTTADYVVSIANPTAENNLLINATASGSIDGIAFGSTALTGAYAGTLLNSINLGDAADTASLADAAGTTSTLILDGGDGFDRLNGNASANTLTLTGLDSGTLDQVSFNNIENIYLQGGDDTVVINAGGRLSGILDGGVGTNTLQVDPSLGITFNNDNTITVGDGGTGGTGGGTFSGFQSVEIVDSNDTGTPETNTITLNANSNTALITGPNSGTVNGTGFTNISDINLAAGDDNAVLAATGFLTGSLDGGEGTADDLRVNDQSNTLNLDQTGSVSISTTGNTQTTTIAGFEIIRLDGGADIAYLSFSGTSAVANLTPLRIDGGADSDSLNLTLSQAELDNLRITDQLTALEGYVAAPTGGSITVNLLDTELILQGFEVASLILPNKPPVADDLTLVTDEDTILNGEVPVASDVDGTIASYELVTSPGSGSLDFNLDGTFSFAPGDAFQDLNDGETAEVSFTYTATDNNGAVSSPAIVTITVNGVTDFRSTSISTESNFLLLSQDESSVASVESYTTERVNLNDGKGKPIWSEQTTYQAIEGGQSLDVDGIVLTTSAADTIISAQGDETTGRFALQKELAIYTQNGVDIVTGSSLGTLYDLGGVSAEGAFDTVNAVSGAKDVIQLGANYDASANGAGHIVINNLQEVDGDSLLLQGDPSRYSVEPTSGSSKGNKGGGKGKKSSSLSTSFSIYSVDSLVDGTRDLIAIVNSSSFTEETDPASFIEYQANPLTSQDWLNSF